MNTWQAQAQITADPNKGNYSDPSTWALVGTTYAVQSIVAANKHVVVAGDASGLAGKTITLNGTTASDGDYTVTTAMYTTTTLLTLVSATGATFGTLADQVGAAGNAYNNGIPSANDTYDINGVAIVQDVNPADGVTLIDSAGAGSLAISGDITFQDYNTAFTSIANPSNINVTGSLTVTGTWLDSSSNLASSLNNTGTITISGTVDLVNAGAANLNYVNSVGTAGGTTIIAVGGTLRIGPTGYADASASSLAINGTFDYGSTGLPLNPTGTLSGNGTILLSDAIGSGFKGIIEDANGVKFYSVGGRIQSIGPWPVSATHVGPYEITPTSLGPFAVN